MQTSENSVQYGSKILTVRDTQFWDTVGYFEKKKVIEYPYGCARGERRREFRGFNPLRNIKKYSTYNFSGPPTTIFFLTTVTIDINDRVSGMRIYKKKKKKRIRRFSPAASSGE